MIHGEIVERVKTVQMLRNNNCLKYLQIQQLHGGDQGKNWSSKGCV